MGKNLLIIALASFLLLCTQIGHENLGREEYCEKVWRYDIECAVKYMFSNEELQKISGTAEKLKGSNCKQTAWNVLEWIDRNLEYDYEKASLPPPKIEISPTGIEIYDEGRYYQTPSETLLLRKGICGDYAILTAALLLYNGCEVYLVNISYYGDQEGHLATVIKLNGTYYFLDQHLPPLDAGSYYLKQLREGRKIKDAVLYSTDGIAKAAIDFNQDYHITQHDLLELEKDMAKIVKTRYYLKEDLKLGDVLPRGYTHGKILTLTMENLADYYTPEFKKEIAEYIIEKIVEREIIQDYRSFKLNVVSDGGNMVIRMYLAK